MVFLAVRVPGCSLFLVVRSSAAMQMSSMIVRSWFVVHGGVRGHSDVINDSLLMVVFVAIQMSSMIANYSQL